MQTSLSSLAKGEKATVIRVCCPEGISRRLMEMGLIEGVHIICIRWAPLRGAIEVGLRGFCLALGWQEAEQIFVMKEGTAHGESGFGGKSQ